MAARLFMLLALAAAGGCSRTDAASTSDAGAEAGVADAGPSIRVTVGTHVAAGTDAYSCQFVALPSNPIFITAFSHAYSTGFHHLLLFRTDLTSMPAGGMAPSDCFGPARPMDHARATLYAVESPASSLMLPSGVALPTTPGEVLLVQAHYLNSTGAEIDAQGSISLDYATSEPSVRAGAFFFYDPFIDIGALQEGKATMRCLAPSNVTVLSTVGAAHSRAIGYEAYLDPPSSTGANPYYHAPGWADPLPLAAALPLAAGSHLRFLCTYANSGTMEFLQGTNADTSEQCILSGLYFPQTEDGFDDCSASPDTFGSGASACPATRACVDSCPPGSAPPESLGLGGEPAIDSCWQRCLVASCPDTSALLFALRSCEAAHCAGACGTGTWSDGGDAEDAGDAGDTSAACATCEAAACQAESAACASDGCK